jgi:hypothetical protein
MSGLVFLPEEPELGTGGVGLTNVSLTTWKQSSQYPVIYKGYTVGSFSLGKIENIFFA